MQSPHSGTGFSSRPDSCLVPLRNGATVGAVLAFFLRLVAQVHSLPSMPELSTEVPVPDTLWSECLACVPRFVQRNKAAGRVSACLLAAESALWEEFGASEHRWLLHVSWLP